jgi:hypothetical protein
VKTWLRRIRGAIGIGLTWAVAWFLAGMVVLFIVGFGAADVPFPLFWGLLGFIGGVTFSGVLRLVEGRRRFDEMSMPRFAAWGGLGGFLLAGVLVPITGAGASLLLLLGPLFATAGAGCAVGSLALARMAEGGALEAVGDVDDIGLTADERKRLLGDGA